MAFIQWPDERIPDSIQISTFAGPDLAMPGQSILENPNTGGYGVVNRSAGRFEGRVGFTAFDDEGYHVVRALATATLGSEISFEMPVPTQEENIDDPSIAQQYSPAALVDSTGVEITDTDFAGLTFSRPGIVDQDGFGKFARILLRGGSGNTKSYSCQRGAYISLNNRLHQIVRRGPNQLRYVPAIQVANTDLAKLNVPVTDPVGRSLTPLRIKKVYVRARVVPGSVIQNPDNRSKFYPDIVFDWVEDL